MRITINGIALSETVADKKSNGVIDWINNGPIGDTADRIIRWETEMIFSPIVNAIKNGMDGIAEILNANSAEIIALGIVICACGMIIAPMFGSTSGKWFGRMTFVFWGGVIWRVLI